MAYSLRIVPAYSFDIGASPLDGDFSKVRVLDDTPDGGMELFGGGGLYSGRAVETAHFPKRMMWEGGARAIPDFDDHHCLNVSEKSKDIIESVEPGVHQFVPVDYVDKEHKKIETRYFLVICNRVDSLDYENTTMVLEDFHVKRLNADFKRWASVSDLCINGKYDAIPAHLPRDTKSRIVISNKKTQGYHLWRERYAMAGWWPWLSDELAEKIFENQLSGVSPQVQEAV